MLLDNLTFQPVRSFDNCKFMYLVTKLVPMFETLIYLNVWTMIIILFICYSLNFMQDGFTLTQRRVFLSKLTNIPLKY
jgi:hypothetical protein